MSVFPDVLGSITHLSADVALEQCSHQFVGGLLEQSHHRLIQRISVLIQPAGDVIGNPKQINCTSKLNLSLNFPR